VIIKEIQHHPIRDQILHVDFQEISLTEKLTVEVPIATKGEAEGVVKEEGVLEHVLWEVKVECLPTDIPEKIELEVTNMKIGDSVLVKDLQVPPGVKILDDAEQTVISVTPPYVEKPAEEVAAEEITEPELIREKKEKEEEETAAEGAAPAKEKKEATEQSKGGPPSDSAGGKKK
jgi:large subunit ribosomal protein L25